MVYLVQILYIYVFKHCPATGMKKDEEASPCIILAGQALLVKMFITFGPHSIILFKFCILIQFEHCPATDMPELLSIFLKR